MPKVRTLAWMLAVAAVAVSDAPASAQSFNVSKGTCSELALPLSAAQPPPGCWRPYADTSPWNTPIPEDARTDPRSAAYVARLAQFGQPQHLVAGQADSVDDWNHPTYYALPTDPVFTLHCTEPWGKCAIEGMRVNIPDAARAAGGGDAHMTIVDQVTGWEYDLYGVHSKPAGGGRLDFRWGGRTRLDGDGLKSDATASRFGNLAGIIRAQELEAGEINHALFMVIYCDSGGFVYPASKNGRSCARLGLPTDDAPPMGTRFQLDMTAAEIDALKVPEYRKVIFRAMARYGLYAGDTGTGSWGIQLESGATYTSFGLEDAAVTYARRVRAPLNGGRYVLNLRDGVDWKSRLRVVDPCITQGTCPADEQRPPTAETPSATASPAPPAPDAPAPTPTTSAPAATSTSAPAAPTSTPASAAPTSTPASAAPTSTPAPAQSTSTPGAAPAPAQSTSTPGAAPAPAQSSSAPDAAPAGAQPGSAVRIRLSRKGNAVLARGEVKAPEATTVTLQPYLSKAAGRPYRRLQPRAATVKNGRFKATVSPFRHGSWRVIARVKGTESKGAGEVRLGESAGEEVPDGPPVQSGFGSNVSPGPLATGGVLDRGARGPAVVFVQNMLTVAGIRSAPTGRFDAGVERAVRRFQRDNALLVDGIVGRQTMAALQGFQRDPR